MMQSEPGGKPGPQPAPPPARTPSVILASELGGSLPCLRCRYDLRGLSIRSVCPECGTPVKVTLLAKVDPLASELRAISWPRLTALGLVVWSTAALLGALAVWGFLLVEEIGLLPSGRALGNNLLASMVVLVALSGVGCAGLVRPHAGIASRRICLAALACGLYLPLCIILWRLVRVQTLGAIVPGADLLRLCAEGIMAIIIMLLRPNARMLASRSLLLRSGKVDRQTMLALVGALAVAMMGDALTIASDRIDGPAAEMTLWLGMVVQLVGAVLFTLGLAGVTLDCWRMWPAIAAPPLSLAQVLGGGQGGAKDHGGRSDGRG